MFTYRTSVRLKDTDATGVLYFSEQFKFALEALEEFLREKGFSLKELIASPYLFPVVHAEGDYFAPLMVGDAVEVGMKVERVGTSSVTLHYVLRDPERGVDVGRVEMVHVVVDRASRTSVPIPDFLRAIFESAMECAVK